MEFLQTYWWVIISLLGAILVFMLFVQGGQTFFLTTNDTTLKAMRVNAMGRKWELSFTSLVAFGGAFFASFPLFYSTAFGGAYYLWFLILLSFVIQAFSYEFRSKPNNIFGQRTYDTFLYLNGAVGCILLGVVVGTMFFGGDFTIAKGNILDGTAPVISRWGDLHGIEAIADWRNFLLGLAVLFLARTQALLYFINNIDDDKARDENRRDLMVNSVIFVVFFVAFVVVLLLANGYEVDGDGIVSIRDYKYFHNLLEMPTVLAMFLVGVVLVLFAIIKTLVNKAFYRGIWFSGIGTVMVVLALFFIAGFNSTPYYPSAADPQSSLTIANSSSSQFTLTVMSWVSLLVPFVVAYIAYVWRAMNRKPITPDEIRSTEHKY
ncbi:MAG: cytochrome d ubiquinol oxidase subunit II [Muribaculaceae bacterium]|nr:cytochrome d ubiquinol oxidase subunit II [Muribaculaceae bacterium]